MSLTVRAATAQDWPLIQRLHAEQNEVQSTSYALPRLFQENGDLSINIAMALMVERDGVPVQSFYFELLPEVCFAGMDAEATAVAQREIERIAFLLRGMGYTGLNCKPPQAMDAAIRKPLGRAGFTEDSQVTHYFKDLRMNEERDQA